jgi:hypothetical protein
MKQGSVGRGTGENLRASTWPLQLQRPEKHGSKSSTETRGSRPASDPPGRRGSAQDRKRSCLRKATASSPVADLCPGRPDPAPRGRISGAKNSYERKIQLPAAASGPRSLQGEAEGEREVTVARRGGGGCGLRVAMRSEEQEEGGRREGGRGWLAL